MRGKLFGAAAALLLVLGTAQKSDAQVYFSYGNGYYGNGFSFGAGGVPYYGGVVQSGFYTPYYGNRFVNPGFGVNQGFGYGYRSYYNSPSYRYGYSPYRSYGNYNYGGRRYRGR